jgi:virginiamycin B lyase
MPRTLMPIAAVAAALCLSLTSPVAGEAQPASPYAAASTSNPYLYDATYSAVFQRGPKGSIDLALTFALGPGIALDPSRVIAKIRRVDGTLRAWEPLTASASAADRIDFPMPSVRGATYEFSFDAGNAVVPGARAPSPEAIAERQRHDELICQNCSNGMNAVNALLLTIPSAPFDPLALARARAGLAGRTAYVWRKGLSFLFDPGNPHSGPQLIRLKIGAPVHVTSLAHGAFALASSEPLGVAGDVARLPRYVSDSIAVDIATQNYGSPILTFVSLDELRLYLRTSEVPLIAGEPHRFTTHEVREQHTTITDVSYALTDKDPSPAVIAAAPDGSLLLADGETGRLARLSTTGILNAYRVAPTAAFTPLSIDAGPDGTLWFPSQKGGIGRTTTMGGSVFMSRFANDEGITEAVGSDRALWFTFFASPKIGRLTPAGAMRQFPLHDVQLRPYRIAQGPDGSMWFTDLNDFTAIRRIAASGVVTSVSLQSIPGATISNLSASGGAAWFGYFQIIDAGQVDGIARVSPSGELTNYRIAPSPPCVGVLDPIASAGNALWFVHGPCLGHIEGDGAVTQYPLPWMPGIQSIAAGTDGSLWFTTATSIDHVTFSR